jgi:hypothetical protein
MSIDADGYGYKPGDRTTERLAVDIRTLSPAGVERIAHGWDHHVAGGDDASFIEAEKAALHAIETADRGAQWDEVRRQLFGLTESGNALVSWKAEHGDVGHKAERAAFAAALGLIAGDLIGAADTRTLGLRGSRRRPPRTAAPAPRRPG